MQICHAQHWFFFKKSNGWAADSRLMCQDLRAHYHTATAQYMRILGSLLHLHTRYAASLTYQQGYSYYILGRLLLSHTRQASPLTYCIGMTATLNTVLHMQAAFRTYRVGSSCYILGRLLLSHPGQAPPLTHCVSRSSHIRSRLLCSHTGWAHQTHILCRPLLSHNEQAASFKSWAGSSFYMLGGLFLSCTGQASALTYWVDSHIEQAAPIILCTVFGFASLLMGIATLLYRHVGTRLKSCRPLLFLDLCTAVSFSLIHDHTS